MLPFADHPSPGHSPTRAFRNPLEPAPLQGYVFLATGAPRYYEMAINAALSARWKDPGKKLCLVHGPEPLPAYARQVFDDFVELPPLENYVGVLNKLRLYELSPYDETFYLDADCLVLKDDMKRHWEIFSGQDVAMAGERATSGTWYGFDIASACASVNAPYLLRGNSGVFFFRKGDKARVLFDDARHLVEDKRITLGAVHQKRYDQLADEPFLAAAMGRTGIAPLSYVPEDGSVMVTTLYARSCYADMVTSESALKKPAPHPLFGALPTDRFLALNYVEHSPTIMHFIDLKPRRLYTKLSRQVREKFDVPAYDFFDRG